MKIKKYLLLGLLTAGVSLVTSLLVSQASFAAYPDGFCEFTQTNANTITAACDDDTSNGTFDGKRFTRSGGSGAFTLKETFLGPDPAYPSSAEPENVTCTATITISGNTARIEGNYKITEQVGPVVAPTTQSRCGALTATNIALNREAVDEENIEGDTTTGGGGSGDETTCAIDGVGWIICPIMTFMAKLNDQAFGYLQGLLAVRPALISDSATKTAWAAFRDIANVAFVIAFLFIVYSQLTNVGLSNYGIKKLLPRIVVAAILVNISYFICAIAVDVSNIVGSNVYSLLGTTLDVGSGSGGGGGETWTNIMAVILAGAAIVLLVVIIILAPTVLLALAVILMILVARQALVILLIVISPLAFVAYLLPNTESWFKKWWKALVVTLMVYPIIGLVFGASTLASEILMNVAGNSSGNDEQLLKIVALAVLALPLFAVPSLLVGSLSAAGSIGARLQGIANKTQGKAAGALKDQAGRRVRSYESRLAARGGALGAIGGYRTRRDFRHSNMDAESKYRQEHALATHVLNNPSKFSDRAVSRATSQLDTAHEEEVKNANTRLQASMGHEEILNAARLGHHNGKALSEHEREAAIRYTTERGNFDERKALAESVGEGVNADGSKRESMTRSQRKSLVNGMQSRGDTSIYGNEALAAIAAAELDSDGREKEGLDAASARKALMKGVGNKIDEGKISAETLTKDYRVAGVVAAAAKTTANATSREALAADIAKFASENPQAWAAIDSKTRGHATSI